RLGEVDADPFQQRSRAQLGLPAERDLPDEHERIAWIAPQPAHQGPPPGVGPGSGYERSPIDKVAEEPPSSASHPATASMTETTLREPHSDSTRTSRRDRSNEIDERSNSLASRR